MTSNQIQGDKNVPLQLYVHRNFRELPRDHKSAPCRSAKTFVLLQHQEQMTLQINICAPHWGDFPINAKGWIPHGKGDGDSGLT